MQHLPSLQKNILFLRDYLAFNYQVTYVMTVYNMPEKKHQVSERITFLRSSTMSEKRVPPFPREKKHLSDNTTFSQSSLFYLAMYMQKLLLLIIYNKKNDHMYSCSQIHFYPQNNYLLLYSCTKTCTISLDYYSTRI